MNRKPEMQGEKPSDIITVAQLCQLVNASILDKAKEEYLEGVAHRHFLIAESMTDELEGETARLLKGDIPPHLFLCCCKDTFAKILAEEPLVRFNGYSPDDEELQDGYPGNAIVCADDLDLGDIDFLTDLAENRYKCILSSYGSLHAEDAERRDAYYKAVLDHLTTAARLAKMRRSDTAYAFLEAIRLLTPDTVRTDCAEGLKLDADAVKAAYDKAMEAHARLWTEKAHAALKPLKTAIGRARR